MQSHSNMKLQPEMKVDLVKNERGEWVLIKVKEARSWVGRYPSCKKPVPYRGTTAVDFLVGALSKVDGAGIMTNDRQIHRIWKDARFF